jgi:hypothetical protein
LPVMAQVAAPQSTAAIMQSIKVSQSEAAGLDCEMGMALGCSASKTSGTLSKIAAFCDANSASDKTPLARLASSSRKSLSMFDMDPTPFSEPLGASQNGAECGETRKCELLVNDRFKNNEYGSRDAVRGTN